MTEPELMPEPERFTRFDPAAQGPREGYWLRRVGNDSQGNALYGWVPIPGYERGQVTEAPGLDRPSTVQFGPEGTSRCPNCHALIRKTEWVTHKNYCDLTDYAGTALFV